MNDDFWHQRWATNQIGFHEGAPNRHLVRFWPDVPAGSRVLVPLCGKSADLAWLAARGHTVVGVELSPVACAAFFAERGVTPVQRAEGAHTAWRAGSVTLLQGDVFDVTDTFDAVWDRAALIALPPKVRARYAPHVRARLAPGAPMLLVALEYDASRRDGPPYSVPAVEVRELYPGIEALHREDVDEARRREIGGAVETVWLAAAAGRQDVGAGPGRSGSRKEKHA
jgi:thiopurine S-methyltransferase